MTSQSIPRKAKKAARGLVPARRFLTPSVVLLVGLLNASEALAESMPPQCDNTLIRVAPDEGRPIPANAPALVVYDRGQWTVEYELISPDGESLDFALEDDSYWGGAMSSARLLRFSVPLVEGKGYELRWTQTCSVSYLPAVQMTGVRVFDVTSAVAWPSVPGKVTTTVQSDDRVTTRVDFSPELQAFLPIASVQFGSDHNGGVARYGYGDYSGGLLVAYWDLHCPAAGEIQDAFVLAAHVAGFTEDPEPSQSSFVYECPEVPVPDGGVVGEDAPAYEVVDTGVLNDGPDDLWEAAPAPSRSGGCAVVAAPGADGAERWALVALTLCGTFLQRIRRTRARSTRSSSTPARGNVGMGG